ncbi:TraR/DksA C4-type zinc finger protein [Streptomyces sp. NPDC002838]|uniref:TraR/DksA family transcriptional regulator n=1 Tax=Streptomyces sp. NPDC002838 TaxID=3154436 RepID=UPI00332A9350
MALNTAGVGSPEERTGVHQARRRLELEREVRLAQLDALNEAEPTADGVLASQKNTVRRALIGIDKALARLNDGVYGTCRNCAQPFHAAQLEIRPLTRYCVTCQQRTG